MAFSMLKSAAPAKKRQASENSTKLKKMIVKSYPDDYYTEFRGRKKS
jgi:hypothetical protein